ncbi:MAG: 50S ribosomal protein L4 [Bradymonadales bacterium]|jgi:large subunit ribosomal protein L4
MKLDLYNLNNEKVGTVDVSKEIFGIEVKPHLFHEVVRMQLANRRLGTHKTKTRSEVRGGGRKPFKQKGTGRARQGTSRSPHMVGGGHAFAKRNRDYSYLLNKKKRRLALCSALSMLEAAGNIKVVENFDLEEIKTKKALNTLLALQLERALVVDCRDGDRSHTTLNNDELRLSVRNLQQYKYIRPEGVNVYDILHYGQLLVTKAGLKRLEARLLG